MDRKELKHYDFETLYQLLGTKTPDHAMLTDNVAMLMDGRKDKIDKVLPLQTPVLLEEARVGIIRKGEADYVVNLMPYKFKEGTVAFLNRGTIIQINQVSDDFEMAGMALSDYLLTASFTNRQDNPLLNDYPALFISVEYAEMEVIEHLFQAAWQMMHQTDYSRDSVGNIFGALLHYINHLNLRHKHLPQKPLSHSREVFNQFIGLINKHSHQERQLDFYSNLLCLSERYLGTLIKQESGMTAKEWIDKAVITDAQVLLKHTDKTIAEISNELNFANPSFFCKYFRRLMGFSPQEYRKK